MSKKTYLIYGISKGLGKAIAQYVPDKNDVVLGVSRTQTVFTKEDFPNISWIPGDLSEPEKTASEIRQRVGSQKIDCLIYNVGIWERRAFSEDYDFSKSSPEEITTLINTNITSCILAIQSFISNLSQSENAKVILIGSTWGLENHKGKEVAFSATKFALRGIVHALRESLRPHAIGISILNLGYLATEYEYEAGEKTVIDENGGSLIPLQDVVRAIRFIISTSRASCVKEIDMPAMQDTNV